MRESPFRVDIEHLRRTPGACLEVAITAPFHQDGPTLEDAPDANGANGARAAKAAKAEAVSVPSDAEMACDLVLESFVGGLRVTGKVSAPWDGLCGRCAVETRGLAVARVDETMVDAVGREVDSSTRGEHGGRRHESHVADADLGFVITDRTVDLGPLLREAIWLDLPLVPVCDEDCKGICPGCGEDMNTSECRCVERGDPRWAILDRLK
ncbi:MAG: DUF177 domain-containing protein [Actinobacteria bacterium]|nr:DUF177 domain-containing protein [Actinomycetota bacterium]MCL5445721.1 DUF177 domain-containing protein [Actinomycetota bacterium]